jgi:hypothetical protein
MNGAELSKGRAAKEEQGSPQSPGGSKREIRSGQGDERKRFSEVVRDGSFEPQGSKKKTLQPMWCSLGQR